MINPFSGVCVCACCGSDLFHQAFCLARQNCSPWKLSLLDQICWWKKAEKCTQTGLPKSTWFGQKKLRWKFPSKSSWNRLKSERFLQIPQPCAFYADRATMCHTWMYSVSASWTGLQPKEQHPDRFAMLPTTGKPHRWMQTSYDSLRQRDAKNYKPVKNTQSFAKRQNNN